MTKSNFYMTTQVLERKTNSSIGVAAILNQEYLNMQLSM